MTGGGHLRLIYTNTIENVLSVFKRGVVGVYRPCGEAQDARGRNHAGNRGQAPHVSKCSQGLSRLGRRRYASSASESGEMENG